MNEILSLATIAAAGLAASSASGQGVTLSFSADRSEVSVGDIVNWTVSASFTGFDDFTAYFGGFEGSFRAAFPNTARILSVTNLMPYEGVVPIFDGATIDDVNIFQAALLGFDDNANPIDIFTFEMEHLATPPVGLNSLTGFDAVGVVSIFPDDGVLTPRVTFEDFEVFTSGVVPTPGAGLAFAVGGLGLAGGRRRRS